MAKVYKWKADTTYQSDTTLSHGVIPTDHTGWQSSPVGTQSGSWTYWFRDANVGPPWTDANSSRVMVSVTETWTATINNRNYLTISIDSIINSVVRDDLRGSNVDSPGRTINIYREQGASPVLSLTDTQLASAHTLFTGPLVLDNFSFTLAPGESLQRSSLYLHNQAIGLSSYDDIWFGVLFLNDLPKETVPHAVRDSSGVWLSHNREGGDLRLWNGSRWTDNLKTVDGPAELGDPPSVYRNDSKWYNGRTFGFGA